MKVYREGGEEVEGEEKRGGPRGRGGALTGLQGWRREHERGKRRRRKYIEKEEEEEEKVGAGGRGGRGCRSGEEME